MTDCSTRYRTLFSLLVSILWAGSLQAADAATVEERIDRLQAGLLPALLIEGEELVRTPLDERMRELTIPGVSIAIINEGKIEWARGFGLADVETDRAVDALTLFQAASISKPVAAMGALELTEQGKLSLDADINSTLSAWHVPASEFTSQAAVTLRGLLSHTAGMTVHGFGGYGPGEAVPSTVGVLQGQGNSDAVFVDVEPGTLWRYSGGGYTVMQQAAQDVTGLSFDRFQAQAVLWSLGMDDSTYQQPLPERFHDRAATGYQGDGTAVPGKWNTYPEKAAAGLWTTPSDLARWLMALQQAGQGATHPVLEPETVQALLTPGMNDWGLGPVIEGEGQRFGHGGSNAGFRCYATALLEGGRGAVIMTNSDNGTTLATEIIMTIGEIYGWPDPSPTVKTVVDLSAEALQAVVGTYSTEGGEFIFSVSHNLLLATTNFQAGEPMKFRPESAQRFFETNGSFEVEFTTNDEGEDVVLINGTMEFKKQ